MIIGLSLMTRCTAVRRIEHGPGMLKCPCRPNRFCEATSPNLAARPSAPCAAAFLGYKPIRRSCWGFDGAKALWAPLP